MELWLDDNSIQELPHVCNLVHLNNIPGLEVSVPHTSAVTIFKAVEYTVANAGNCLGWSKQVQ